MTEINKEKSSFVRLNKEYALKLDKLQISKEENYYTTIKRLIDEKLNPSNKSEENVIQESKQDIPDLKEQFDLFKSEFLEILKQNNSSNKSSNQTPTIKVISKQSKPDPSSLKVINASNDLNANNLKQQDEENDDLSFPAELSNLSKINTLLDKAKSIDKREAASSPTRSAKLDDVYNELLQNGYNKSKSEYLNEIEYKPEISEKEKQMMNILQPKLEKEQNEKEELIKSMLLEAYDTYFNNPDKTVKERDNELRPRYERYLELTNQTKESLPPVNFIELAKEEHARVIGES